MDLEYKFKTELLSLLEKYNAELNVEIVTDNHGLSSINFQAHIYNESIGEHSYFTLPSEISGDTDLD